MTSGVVADARAVAEDWNSAGYDWVIAHGAEEAPGRLGRDLDILMARDQAVDALGRARTILRDRGWEILVCPPPLWGLRLVALRRRSEGDFAYLELHTMPELRWALLPVARAGGQVVQLRGPFPTSEWISFAKGMLMPLLAGDLTRFDQAYLDRHRVPDQRRAVAGDRLAELVGTGLARRLLDQVDGGHAEGVTALAPSLRRAALRRMVTSPGPSLTCAGRVLSNRAARFHTRTGLRVTVEADWTETEQSQLENLLGQVFVDVVWTPSGSAPTRARQQYDILSGQGVVLEVRPRRRERSVTVTGASGFGRARPIDVGAGAPTTVADRIVEAWADAHRCGDTG